MMKTTVKIEKTVDVEVRGYGPGVEGQVSEDIFEKAIKNLAKEIASKEKEDPALILDSLDRNKWKNIKKSKPQINAHCVVLYPEEHGCLTLMQVGSDFYIGNDQWANGRPVSHWIYYPEYI